MTYLTEASLQKYLWQLKKQIRDLPLTERQDLLQELESHFYEELQQGRSPEVILAGLGQPAAYAQQFLSQYAERLSDSGRLPEHARFMFRRAWLPLLVLGLGFLGLLTANLLWIFWQMMAKHPSGSWRALPLVLFGMPAMLSLLLPTLPLILVPRYLYGLGHRQPQRILRSSKVWLMTLLTGLGLGLFSLGVQEVVVPASNHQVLEVMKDLMNEGLPASGKPKLVFSEEVTDIRLMTMTQAYGYLVSHPQDADYREKLTNYYLKLALPLAAPVFALFGLLTASLMLSGLFHPLYTLLMIGGVLPLGIWYGVYALALGQHAEAAIAAFAPTLTIAAVALFFLFGLFLQLPRRLPEFA